MDIEVMIKEYSDWLKSSIFHAKVGEFYELTTPYYDRYNDALQIYVREEENGSFFLTDDGAIITNLESSGVSFERSKKRKEMLSRIARRFDITVKGNELTTLATRSTFPQRKHMLIQAMLTVDDMFIAEPGAVKSFFSEDVGLFFDANEIFYSRDFSVMGKTGSPIVYDYHIQRTKIKPERFCKAINRLTKNSRDLALFNWLDTKEQRTDESELILILNDEQGVDEDDLEAIVVYDVRYILWSQRKTNIALLT